MGYPSFLYLYKGGQNIQRLLLVQLRQAHSLSRAVHAANVLHRAEQLYAAIGTAVCLQPLKDLGTVVQNGRGGVQVNTTKGYDAGILPALTKLVLHDEHMIGKDLAKAQLILRRHGPLLGCFCNLDLHKNLPKQA